MKMSDAERDEDENDVAIMRKKIEELMAQVKQEQSSREQSDILLEQSERLLEQERSSREQIAARLDFRNHLNVGFTSLEELIELCLRCNYPSSFNENDVGEYMGPSDAANASTIYINASESCVSENQMASNSLQISRVRTKMLQGTESKLEIRLWDLDDQNVIEAILHSGVFDARNDLETFIEEQSEILEMLRQALHFLHESGGCCSEVTEFQPLFILFLEPIAARLRPASVVKCAQGLNLHGTLFIGDDTHDSVEKIVNGHTDVIVLDARVDEIEIEDQYDWQQLDRMICHLELKPPFGPLRHPYSFREKDQLLIESEIVGQMLCSECRVLGALTDLFAIAIMVRVPFPLLPFDDDSNSNRPVSFISHRVAHSRPFLLRLMFLLGDYDEDQWTLLLSRSKTPLVLNDTEEEEEAEKAEDEKCPEGDKLPPPPRVSENNVASRTRTRTAAATRAIASFYSDDREDFIAESTKRLLKWECKRHGLSYLSEDELNRRNALQYQSKTL